MIFKIIDTGPGPFFRYELIQATDAGSLVQAMTIGDREALTKFRNMINDALDKIGGLDDK